MDLYIPVLTFVFGEAQLSDGGAVVSAHRLRQEFYGMPTDPELLHERLLKESLHELGHTYGLRHCPDYTCVMSSSNGGGTHRLEKRRVLRQLRAAYSHRSAVNDTRFLSSASCFPLAVHGSLASPAARARTALAPTLFS